MNNFRFVTRVTCLFVCCVTAASIPVSYGAEAVPKKDLAKVTAADQSVAQKVESILAANRFTQCREYLDSEKARLSSVDYNYWYAKCWLREEQNDELTANEKAMKDSGVSFSSRGGNPTVEEMPTKLRNAMTAVNLAIGAGPERADLYQLRSEIHSQWNMDVPALIDASKAIELEPNNANRYVLRAASWYAASNLKPSDVEACSDPQLKARLLVVARLSDQSQARARYKEALSDIDAAMKLNPKDAYSYSLRSKVLHAMGDRWIDVLKDQTRAIELDSRDASYYHDRAYTWQWLTPPDFEKALCDVDKAIDLEPHQSSHRMLRANFLLALHRWDEVDAEYVILDKMCDGGWYRQQKADAKFAMGKLDEAIKIWELNKDSTSVTKAAYASLRLHKPDKAIKLCDRAFELKHGPQLQAHWIKAQALEDDGQNSLAAKEAKLTLEMAKDAYPSDFNYAPRFFPPVTKSEIEAFYRAHHKTIPN